MNCFLCFFFSGGGCSSSFLVIVLPPALEGMPRSSPGCEGGSSVVKKRLFCVRMDPKEARWQFILLSFGLIVTMFLCVPLCVRAALVPLVSVISDGDQFDPRQKAKARISRENNAKSTCRREIFFCQFFSGLGQWGVAGACPKALHQGNGASAKPPLWGRGASVVGAWRRGRSEQQPRLPHTPARARATTDDDPHDVFLFFFDPGPVARKREPSDVRAGLGRGPWPGGRSGRGGLAAAELRPDRDLQRWVLPHRGVR